MSLGCYKCYRMLQSTGRNMITVRQLERLWQEKAFDRMSRLLLEMRPESSVRLASQLSRSVPAAALAMIRLDELSQSHSSLCPRLIRHILAAQEADGGWGDALTTDLCIRALACGRGDGPAITRGIEFLANLQKDDGSWPRVPLRRLPGDAFTTALVLFHILRPSASAGASICAWRKVPPPSLVLPGRDGSTPKAVDVTSLSAR
jgi:hypothetical protein